MTPEVKSAWIGSGSAIFVALISAVATYFIAVRTQTSQPDPVVIREPYIVEQKETIREYCYEQPADEVGKPASAVVDTEPTEEVLKVDEVDAVDILQDKSIGIYYSYGDRKTKSLSSSLVGAMNYRDINATFYSIGRFYSAPNVPSSTKIYGIGADIDEDKFLESFREDFRLTGPVELVSGPLVKPPAVDGYTWPIRLDKDIYIIVGS